MRASIVISLSLLILAALPLAAVMAQTDRQIEVDHLAVVPQQEGLELQLFFRLAENEGGGSPTSITQNGAITLLSQPDNPYDAAITSSGLPYHTVVIMGNGAASEPYYAAMQDAAANLILSAPGEARFALIQYSDFNQRVIDTFIESRQEMVFAVDQLPATSGETLCLNDAMASGISLLDSAALELPAFPKGMIVIGSERELQPQTEGGCGSFTLQTVIDQANAANIEIHTLNFDPEAGLGSDPLNFVAKATGGNAVLVNQNQQLSVQPETIFSNLSEQFVARVRVMPPEGRQTAILSMELGDGPLTQAFDFVSPQAFDQPVGPPAIADPIVTYDPEGDLYSVEVGLRNLQANTGSLLMQIWSEETGIQVYEAEYDGLGSGTTIEFGGAAAGLEPEGAYRIRLIPIALNRDTFVDEEGEELLAERLITYLPQLAPQPRFLIDSISPDIESGELTLFFVAENLPPNSTVSGYFENEEATREADIGPIDLTSNGRLSVPLPVLELETGGE
ncbi:MAG: hypothetical protein AAF633_27220, partial [Chloroflexota bacterium]